MSARFAISSSGLRISSSAGASMSAAVTTPGPFFAMCTSTSGDSPCEPRDEVLEVEDDVGDVLAHARQRRELVRGALDLHRGDGGALQRGEQHAAQRVAERVTEAAVERLDDEDPAMVVHFLVDDLRDLEVHFTCRQRNSLFPLLRVELDDELFLHRRVDLVALGLLQNLAREPVVVGLEPRRDGRHEVGRVADHLLRR